MFSLLSGRLSFTMEAVSEEKEESGPEQINA